MSSEPQEKRSWRNRLFRRRERTQQEQERFFEIRRLAISILGGGLMICFSNFTVLVQLIEGLGLLLLVIGMGILMGLFSSQIQYAVLAGFLALILGAIFFFLVIMIPAMWFISATLGNLLLLIALFSLVRAIPIQIFGIIIGTFIGKVIGPAWY